MNNAFLREAKNFRVSEDGSSTIESLFWIPIFAFFLVLILDVSFILFGKAQALRYIQDGNRALSVGAFTDPDEAALFMQKSISHFAPSAEVETVILDGMIISTVMSMPATDVMIVGSLPLFDEIIIKVRADHFLEQ